jgi:hypothetical protein
LFDHTESESHQDERKGIWEGSGVGGTITGTELEGFGHGRGVK